MMGRLRVKDGKKLGKVDRDRKRWRERERMHFPFVPSPGMKITSIRERSLFMAGEGTEEKVL